MTRPVSGRAATAFDFRDTSQGISLEKALPVLLIVLLAAAGGGRWFAEGRDYSAYVEFYDRLGLATNIADERFEIGYSAGAWVFKMILGLPYAVYASVLVGLALTVKFTCFYRYCDRPLLACLVYCASFYPLHEYTQIRIAVALAFGLIGCLASTRGRLVEAAIWIAIGALFHTSELVLGLGVGLAVLIRLPWRLATSYIMAVLVTIYFVFPTDPISLLTIANPFAREYIEGISDDVPNLIAVENVVIAVSILLCYPAVSNTRDRVLTLSYIMLLLAMLFFMVLVDVPAFAFRFRELFAIFGLIVVFRRSEWPLTRAAGLMISVLSFVQLRSDMTQGLI